MLRTHAKGLQTDGATVCIIPSASGRLYLALAFSRGLGWSLELVVLHVSSREVFRLGSAPSAIYRAATIAGAVAYTSPSRTLAGEGEKPVVD